MFEPAEVIEEESRRLTAVVGSAVDLESPVPACPDWTLFDLVAHVGTVQRFWAEVVRTGERPSIEPAPPTRDMWSTDLAGWYQDSGAELVAAIRSATPNDRCWTWWGEPATVGAVARHQVQEVAVHRWDAESAAGTPRTSIDPEVADDGVTEFLSVMTEGALDALSPAVRLHATDTGSSWTAGQGEVAATVQGPASNLVLLLYRRVPLRALQVDGDLDAAAAVIAATDAE